MPIPENSWSGAALRQVSDENDLELVGRVRSLKGRSTSPLRSSLLLCGSCLGGVGEWSEHCSGAVAWLAVHAGRAKTEILNEALIYRKTRRHEAAC